MLVQNCLNLILSSFPSNVCSETLKKFLEDIQSAYADTAQYHSEAHATWVVQASDEIFRKSAWKFSIDSRLAHLALLTAASAHDAGHPGTNQTGQNPGSLEQRHADVTMQSLSRHDFLINSSHREKRLFKALVTKLILNTDMSLHGHLINQSRKLWDKTPAKSFNTDLLALTVMLKAADIWHTTFDWSPHRQWSDRFTQELTGTPLNLSKAEDTEHQIWFMRTIAIPMIHTVCRIAPLEHALRKCYANLDAWCKTYDQGSAVFSMA